MRKLLLLSIALIGCGASVAQVPTWSDDVACVVYSHCTSCHHDGGPAHFDLVTYTDGFFWRNEMRTATQTRYMPPWPPDPTYRSLAHERTLTQDEIDLIAAWVDGGAPEGVPANAPPAPVFTNTPVITDPDITVIMDEYMVPPSTTDNYRSFVLPISNPTDRFITGVEVIPGNTEMVHHVLVYQDTTGQARALDDADIAPGYDSFGGIGVEDAKLLGIWVPGAQPIFTPPAMGIKLFANADLVIQVHYPNTGVPQPDATRVNIALSDGGFIREMAIDPVLDHYWAITDGPLSIPANTVRTFHSEFTVPLPATITAIGPHSHLLGKHMRSFAVVPDGDTIPLIDIPDWDFRWQGMYNFRRPIFLPPGTVLHGEATYDNTTANEDNPNSPPALVELGESTTDEMMLFYFAYTYGFPNDTTIVVDDVLHAPHYLDCGPMFDVGVDEMAPTADLRAWPIPARDEINVVIGTIGGEFTLTDPTGRLVRRMRAHGTTTTMSVHDLARGVYLLRSTSGTRATRTIKVLLE